MGKLTHAPVATNAEQQMPRKRRRGSSETPSANALRERVRAQNMKRAYLNLQKTLPQVPPDTKLPRLNILLLAIDYISHLRCMLRSENQTERSLNSLEDKNGMFRPFIEKWPIRTQLLSDFLRPQVNESQMRQQIFMKEKRAWWKSCLLEKRRFFRRNTRTRVKARDILFRGREGVKTLFPAVNHIHGASLTTGVRFTKLLKSFSFGSKINLMCSMFIHRISVISFRPSMKRPYRDHCSCIQNKVVWSLFFNLSYRYENKSWNFYLLKERLKMTLAWWGISAKKTQKIEHFHL